MYLKLLRLFPCHPSALKFLIVNCYLLFSVIKIVVRHKFSAVLIVR